MTIVKTPIQRTVTISIAADGIVTHAWQEITFAIAEDGVEISRSISGRVNIDPADLGEAVPQADLLKQIADLNEQLAALTTTHDEVAARNAAALAALSG
jgi:hypothetical protein